LHRQELLLHIGPGPPAALARGALLTPAHRPRSADFVGIEQRLDRAVLDAVLPVVSDAQLLQPATARSETEQLRRRTRLVQRHHRTARRSASIASRRTNRRCTVSTICSTSTGGGAVRDGATGARSALPGPPAAGPGTGTEPATTARPSSRCGGPA